MPLPHLTDLATLLAQAAPVVPASVDWLEIVKVLSPVILAAIVCYQQIKLAKIAKDTGDIKKDTKEIKKEAKETTEKIEEAKVTRVNIAANQAERIDKAIAKTEEGRP